MCSATSVLASSEAFNPGMQIKGFGKIASVDTTFEFPKNTKFKVVFDVHKTSCLQMFFLLAKF